jgi:transcriptional regulator with XRE-family HTH domain
VKKEKFNKKLGKFIVQKRLAKGLTQSDLASLLGNNPQNISRIERGEVNPTIFWLYQLSAALEISLAELIHEFEKSSL